jgi:hypothetical protein
MFVCVPEIGAVWVGRLVGVGDEEPNGHVVIGRWQWPPDRAPRSGIQAWCRSMTNVGELRGHRQTSLGKQRLVCMYRCLSTKVDSWPVARVTAWKARPKPKEKKRERERR